MAYNLMLYPIQAINSIVGRVLFPAFSRIQHDRPRLQAAFLRAITTIGAIAFPVMLGLMVTAGPFIHAILGSKWEPVIPLFLILAPIGLMQSVVSPSGHLYTSTGRSDWFFRWGVVACSITVIGFLIGIKWGAIGVATTYVITNVLLLYPNLKIPFTLIALPLRTYFGKLAPLLGIGLVMSAVALLWRALCYSAGITQPLFVLASTSVIGALVYFSLLLRINPPGVDELVGFLPLGRLPWLNRAIQVASGRSQAAVR
jgi:PST family polysaccharide transporter